MSSSSSESVADKVDAFVTNMVEANMKGGVPMTVESVMSRILQKFFPTTSASCIPVAIKQLPSLSRLVALQGRITAKIVAAVSTRPIVTLYELQEEIVMSEGVGSFRELGLGSSILALEVCKTFFNSFFGSTGDSGGDIHRLVRVVDDGPPPIRTSDFVGWLLSCDSAQSLLTSSDTIVLIEAFVRDFNRTLAATKGLPRIANTRLTGIHIENVSWLIHLVREAAGSYNARFNQEVVAWKASHSVKSVASLAIPIPNPSRMHPLSEAAVRAPLHASSVVAAPEAVVTSKGGTAISIDMDFDTIEDEEVASPTGTSSILIEAWSSPQLCGFLSLWGNGMPSVDAAFLRAHCFYPSQSSELISTPGAFGEELHNLEGIVKYALEILVDESDSPVALLMSRFVVAVWLQLHDGVLSSRVKEVLGGLSSSSWAPALHWQTTGGPWVSFVSPGQVLDVSPSVGKLFDQFKKTSAVCLRSPCDEGLVTISRPVATIPPLKELCALVGNMGSSNTWKREFLDAAGVIVDPTGRGALDAIGFICGLDMASSISSLRLPVALIGPTTSTIADDIVAAYNAVSTRWAADNASGSLQESGIRYLFVPSLSSVVGWFVPVESVFGPWANASVDGVGYGEYLLPLVRGPFASSCVSLVDTASTLTTNTLLMCLPGSESLFDESIAGEVDLEVVVRGGLQCSVPSWITAIRAFRTLRALEQRPSLTSVEGDQVQSLTELMWGSIAYQDGGWSDDVRMCIDKDEPLVYVVSSRGFKSLNSRIYFTDAIIGCNPRLFRSEEGGDSIGLNLLQLVTIGRRCPDVYIRSLLTSLGIRDVYDEDVEVTYTSISNVPSSQVHSRIASTLPYIQAAVLTAEYLQDKVGVSLLPSTYWCNGEGGPSSVVQKQLSALSVVVCSTPHAVVRLCDAAGKRHYRRWPIKVHYSTSTSTVYLSETDCSAFIVAEGLTEVLVPRHLHFSKVHDHVRSQCRSLVGRPPSGRPYFPTSPVSPPQWSISQPPQEKPRVTYPPGHGASDQRILSDTVMPSFRAMPEMSTGASSQPIIDKAAAEGTPRLPDSFLRMEPVYLPRFEGEAWDEAHSEAAALADEARNTSKRLRDGLEDDEVQFGQHEAVADFCSNGGVGSLGSRSSVVSSMKGDYQMESENYSRAAERYAAKWLREKYGGTFVWVNEAKEAGTPYDVMHVQYNASNPGALPRVLGFYEVKCTSTKGRRAFEISLRELLLAAKYGDNFTILRVYNAYDDSTSTKDGSLRHNVRGMEVEEFRNPIKLWRQRRLVLSGGINAVAI